MHTTSGDPGLDRLADGVGGEGRRHIDHRRIGGLGGLGLGNGVEHRQAQVSRAAFPGRHAGDHVRAVGHRLLGMERALRAGDALTDYLGFFADQDGHRVSS